MANKRFQKFLNFDIQRFTNTLTVVQRERDRLTKQGYSDIREVFAPMQYIVDVVTLNCDQNCITVEFCFGTIENSPVDGYGVKQIDEIIAFIKSKLNYAQQQLEYHGLDKD